MTWTRVRPYLVIAAVILAVIAGLVVTSSEQDEGPGDGSNRSTGSSTNGGPGAGIGTAEALAAHDCDRATGRLAISYVYAPPCVVPWEDGAGNGGETSPGVTADTIEVIYYSAQSVSEESAAELERQFQTSVDVFQHFYRTWGREVEVRIFNPSGTDEVAQRADAIAMANERPFAVLAVSGTSDVMATELANRGVLALMINPGVELTQQLAPYIWGVGQAGDRAIQINAGAYIGSRLAGKDATFAGDSDFHSRERTFGLVYPETWDLDPFEETLAANGGELADAISYSRDQASFAERARVIAAQLKDAGVTSVVLATDFSFTPTLLSAATGQDYYPEWVMTGTGAQDVAVFARGWDHEQWSNAFGLGAIAPAGVAQDEDTPLPEFGFYRWYWGNADNLVGDFHIYMTLLFTGVHGAGPDLTPETFRDGVFALPPSGGSASGGVMSALLSYGPASGYEWDDYNGYDDFTEIYWDPAATGRDVRSGLEETGHYRHLRGGQRFRVGEYPDEDPAFFRPDGTVIRFDAYPESDAPPRYPCDGCPSADG